MTPSPRPFDLKGSAREGWWLTGGVEGDVKLPMTRGCAREGEALEAAEAWLAPEIEKSASVPRAGFSRFR